MTLATSATPERVTPEDPSGARPYDHFSLAFHLPEWHAAVAALDALVHAISGSGLGMGQKRWLAAVQDVAAALPFHDRCQTCSRAGIGPVENRLVPPAALEPRGPRNWLATYFCPRCRTTWTCGYARDLPALI